jgi:hypothetical protein
MRNEKLYQMTFAKLYPLYVNKAKRKGRNQDEVDTIITWLTGYNKDKITQIIDQEWTVESFFNKAIMNEHANKISGIVCGIRVEDVKEPLMQQIRYLDKLIDELAKGKSMDKILRK